MLLLECGSNEMQVLQIYYWHLLTTLLFRSADVVSHTEIVSGLHLQCLLEDSNCASDPASREDFRGFDDERTCFIHLSACLTSELSNSHRWNRWLNCLIKPEEKKMQTIKSAACKCRLQGKQVWLHKTLPALRAWPSEKIASHGLEDLLYWFVLQRLHLYNIGRPSQAKVYCSLQWGVPWCSGCSAIAEDLAS